VTPRQISRRNLLLGPAGLLGCGPGKATRFPGYCLVANQSSRSIGVVDLTKFRAWPQIPIDANPGALLPHPALPKAFALAPDAGVVYEIDAASLSISRRLRAGSQAVSMLPGPRHEALWVLYSEPKALVEVPLVSLRPARRIRLAVRGTDFDINGNYAAVASRLDRSIVMTSLSSGAIEWTVPAREPSILRFRPDGRQLIVGESGRILTILDSLTGKTVVRLPMPLEPRNFCFGGEGDGQLFVTGPGVDAVVVVYPYQTEIAETRLAGRAPDAMASVDQYLLVTNPETNGITVLSTDDYRRIAQVEVGQEPRHILVTPDPMELGASIHPDSCRRKAGKRCCSSLGLMGRGRQILLSAKERPAWRR
jgi:DNA-binding beta-propeller fold protein YncE